MASANTFPYTGFSNSLKFFKPLIGQSTREQHSLMQHEIARLSTDLRHSFAMVVNASQGLIRLPSVLPGGCLTTAVWLGTLNDQGDFLEYLASFGACFPVYSRELILFLNLVNVRV